MEAGTYRVVLEMKTKDGTPHYLAAEFDVEYISRKTTSICKTDGIKNVKLGALAYGFLS